MAFNFRQIASDFDQKFTGTYVHVKTSPSATPELFYLKGIVSNDNGPPIITLLNQKKGSISLSYSTECEITFQFPQTGYFWHNEQEALLFRRMPARRWKRGVCAENSKIIVPYALWTRSLGVPITEKVLLEAFNPSYKSFTEAKDLLSSQKVISVPLSGQLALGASPSVKHPEPIIWFMAKPIASVHGRYIRMRESQFTQEIIDYMQKSGEYAEII